MNNITKIMSAGVFAVSSFGAVADTMDNQNGVANGVGNGSNNSAISNTSDVSGSAGGWEASKTPSLNIGEGSFGTFAPWNWAGKNDHNSSNLLKSAYDTGFSAGENAAAKRNADKARFEAAVAAAVAAATATPAANVPPAAGD